MEGEKGILVAAYAIVGSVALYCVANATTFIWKTMLRPGHDLKKKYGGWAVVTGCTDGIGKAFCEELAKKNIPLLLVSRTESKLENLASELKSKHGESYQVKWVAADFGNATESTWKSVLEAINSIDVGILINNVGLSYPHAEYLHNLDDELISQLIKINIESTTKMTSLALPGMIKRKSGAIVNIGSGAATVIPSDPLYAIYAASKGYVDQFSRTLHAEYKRFNIDVQLQAPLFVVSKMSKIRRSSIAVPTAKAYAKAGLRTIGYEPRVSPFWVHSIMWAIISCIPESMMDNIRYKQSLSIRKRALAKKAKSS